MMKNEIPRIGSALVLLVIFGCTSTYAANENSELRRFEFDIEYLALKAVNREINATEFAKNLNLADSLYPPRLSPDQVKRKIEKDLQELVDKKFPDSRYQVIKREAEEKYSMYNVNEHIKIERQYAGQLMEVEGRLEVVSIDLVKISGLPIPKRDIPKQYLARLFWSDHEDAIRKYVRQQTRSFEEKRDDFRKKARGKLSRRIWTDAGYRKNKKTSRWVPIMSVFHHQYEKIRGKILERVREEMREQVYRDNRYVLVPEKGGWVLESDLILEVDEEEEGKAAFLGRVKDFFKTAPNAPPTVPKTDSAEPPAQVAAKEMGTETAAPEPESAAATEDDDDDLWGEEDLDEWNELEDEQEAAAAEPSIDIEIEEPEPEIIDEDVRDLFDEGD